MAVTKETGAIVANANSYATVGEADNYHEEQGNTSWESLTDEVKEAALVRGTLMLESRYRDNWIGYKTNNNQGVVQRLAWPRKENDTQPTQDDATVDDDPQALTDNDNIVIGVNEVPLVVQYACMEAAYMHAINNSLVPNVVGQDRYVESVKVDMISRTYNTKNMPAVDKFPFIDQLLSSVASTGGEDLKMVISITEAEADAITQKSTIDDYFESLRDA